MKITMRPLVTVLLVGTAVVVAVAHPTGAVGQERPALTVETAPERLVYEVLFESVVAWDSRARNPSLRAVQRDAARQRMKGVTGLDEVAYEVLRSVAYQLHTSLEEIGRSAGSSLAKGELTVKDKQALANYRARRDAQIDGAVSQLRDYLGTPRFEELDRNVRGHIVPRLEIRNTPRPRREGQR